MGPPIEWAEEEPILRLSAYQDKLLALYANVPDFVLPRERLNEVASFVKGGLKDLSVSRTTFDWGIKVPDAPSHVMYVWMDALTNYITAAGYPDVESDEFQRYWPANLHVTGKDIVRFHAVYWPAFLMSAGVAVPQRVFSHGFLLNRGEKMSKSVGNVVDPFTMAAHYGVDQVRYFFMREVSFGQDGSYNHEAIVARINADLANDLGNLAQRSLSMVAKQLGGVLPEPGEFTDNDKEILAEADAMLAASRTAMATQQIHQWLNVVWSVVAEANRYFAGEAPWALAKTDPARQKTVLYVTAEVVRQVAILTQPVMPDASAKLLDSLGASPGRTGLRSAQHADQGRRNPAAAGRRVSALRRTKGGLNRLQAMLVDSHCHLDFPDFAEDLDGIVARAETAGIGRIVTISTRVKRLGGLLAIAERFPNVYCSVGTHPHHADEEDGIPAGELIELAKHPKVVALGEAGLDYFYEHGSREAQERGFRAHIAAARATGLPLVIHTREADEDCGRILEDEVAKGPFRAVLHCYTGGRELAMKAIGLGLSISFTGILTFKKSRSPARSRRRTPGRSHHGRNRLALSGARQVSRQAQRTVLRGRSRKSAGGDARRLAGRDFAPDDGKLLPAIFKSAVAEGCRMTVTLTILGCGSSAGVPRPALGWGACDPNNPKNRRRRCSLLVERTGAHGTTRIVIDTSPDLREQLIDANVDHIDAVFLTHEHADQTHGIDDLRSVVHAPASAHSGLFQPIDRQRHHGAVLLLLHLARGQRLSADPDAAFDRSGRES